MTVQKRLPRQPAERALKVIAGRWKPAILWHLDVRPHRLSELERLLPEITQKVLIQQLRAMEAHGLVTREGKGEPGGRVDYHLTALGTALVPLIRDLCTLGRLVPDAADGGSLADERLAGCAAAPANH